MRALFLGEGDLFSPARYLAAVLTWAKIPFDHRPDQHKIPKHWRKKRYDVVILSDYRYSSWTPCAREWLIDQVLLGGTRLLMIGGWASFTGLVGNYSGTDLERLLPVTCAPRDDRIQNATGAILLPSGEKPENNGVPIVCGYHRAKPKPGTRMPFVFRDLLYRRGRVTLGVPQPAVVLGKAGRGHTAAFLTDCAPHWAGGLVDWGTRRITIQIKSGITVEVGDRYLHFMRELVVGGERLRL